MAKICIIHRHPLSLVKTTNPSINLFLNKLIKQGHLIYFVSFKETSPTLFVDKINYFFIPFSFRRESAIDLYLKSSFFIMATPWIVRKINKKIKFDLIYCDDSLPFYGFFIKLVTNIKTIVRVDDFMTAYLLADTSPFLFRIIHYLEKKMWQRVDRIVVATETFKRFMIKEGIPANKIEVVEECIDLSIFRKGNKEILRKKFNLPDNLSVVMFHGLMAKMKGLEILIKAIELLKKEGIFTKFILVGEGPEFRHIQNLIKRKNLIDTVILTGWVPFDEIPHFLDLCDFGIVMRNSNLGNNFIITTALMQYWALRKPVLVPSLSAFKEVIEQSGGGIIYLVDNYIDLADKIKYALANLEKIKRLGENGYKFLNNNLRNDLIADKLNRVLLNELSQFLS